MKQAKRVTMIPATLEKFSSMPKAQNYKRRVAGYARVSTDNDEQFSSYEAQVDYYTSYIKSHDDWQFVEVYTDEGISGTNTKHRAGFNRMIEDALNGKIDLILTKSVSRFARNTVDSLTTIRKLKDKGVEVYFEKENIWTFDSKGEMLLTIMSSLAQEEARSISENVTWGIRKRFADGKVIVPYKSLLGYEKGPDGGLVVNEKEVQIVRMIFGLFLCGKSACYIAKQLTELKIPTPRGNSCWNQSTIRSILSNEKYVGEAILQKTFCPDFLTKKRKTNNGEVPKYHVENDHEPIIDKDIFDYVQVELKKPGRRDSASVFSGRLVCAECGNHYGSKVWHSNDKNRKVVWQCNGKYRTRGCSCHNPHVTEDEIKAAFMKAQNSMMANRKKIMDALENAIMKEYSSVSQQKELASVEQEMTLVSELANRSIKKPVTSTNGEGSSEYDELAQRFEALHKRHDELEAEITERNRRRGMLKAYFKELSQQEEIITEFDENLFSFMIDHATVYPDKHIVFTFKDGRTA